METAKKSSRGSWIIARARGSDYDAIGKGYARFRRPDHRLSRQISSALGDARSVVNLGAGAGSYEPHDREVIAVEPSAVMISQRPPGSAPVIQACAEAVPLENDAVDAALAVFTIHHWRDLQAGLREMLRVARKRILIVTMDVDVFAEHWLVRDYLPEVLQGHAATFPRISSLLESLSSASSVPMPVPGDCTDGFFAAYWSRPEAYLDPAIRHASSPWHQLPSDVVARALISLEQDLASGKWDRRYGHLRVRDSLDVGLRLVCAEA